MKIVPMRDLKDTVKIESMCIGKNEPVFVTKNGYGRLVVMDIEYFESIMRQAYEAKLLNEAIDEYENGKVVDGKIAIEELKNKYGF
ncbi:MAG: type II toxin-antitoxin system Phd/YefM family antitoxin [Erysipelotrichaceae bacterium]|nr:type II toxin-antitoxin system Phd/YefM family antitoxin [Erysipelotrichaceae bacterium]